MTSAPLSQARRSRRRVAILIDSFSFSTWQAVAALAQCALLYISVTLFLLVGYLLGTLLAFRTLDAGLIHYDIKRNRWTDGVHPDVMTALTPEQDSTAGGDITVFLVGARVNHPPGIFAPGVQDFVRYFSAMADDLEGQREEFGMLGASSWIQCKERSANNDILYIYYFRDVAGVDRFAQRSISHRAGWEWYSRWSKTHKHLSLKHELYHVPRGHWRNVFLNSHPTLVGATVHYVESEDAGVGGECQSVGVSGREQVCLSAHRK